MSPLRPDSTLPSLQELSFPRAAVRVLAACASPEVCDELSFRDQCAGWAFERLGGDARSFDLAELRSAVRRASVIDALARDYFARNDGALGVGIWSLLGTRGHRLHGARWVDVDAPQVARLRRCVLPERRGWLQLATCACRSHWVDAVCGTAGRRLLLVMDESVLPLPAETVMRLLDDISRRVPAGSELIMASDAQTPLRRAERGSGPATLELAARGADGAETLVRYPRLRFVEADSYANGLSAKLESVNAASGPALAHFRLV